MMWRLFFACALASASTVTAIPSVFYTIAGCSPSDSLPACQLKKGACMLVNDMFTDSVTPLTGMLECANSTGLVPNVAHFVGMGLAFGAGTPEAAIDTLSGDTTTLYRLRKCYLIRLGLLLPGGELNRTALVESAKARVKDFPSLEETMTQAAMTCPEPPNYNLDILMECLYSSCMRGVSVPPIVPNSLEEQMKMIKKIAAMKPNIAAAGLGL